MRAAEASGRGAVVTATLAGLSGGVALAIRPQLVLNVAIAGWMMLRKRPHRARIAALAGLGLVIPVAAVLAVNAAAAGRFVGISENGGFNFFQGHCPVHTVTTGNPSTGFLVFASPVVVENNRGLDYVFPTHLAWEQSYFLRQGLRCMKADPAGQFEVVARNVADLGITSVPWPQAADRGLRRFVRPTNIVYSALLPSIVVASIFVSRRKRAKGRRGGEGLLVAHLLVVLPTAVVFYGDPRFRVPYDVFGLALIAVLIAEVLVKRHGDTPEPDIGEPDIGEPGRRDGAPR